MESLIINNPNYIKALEEEDPNLATNIIIEVLQEALDKLAPINYFQIKEKDKELEMISEHTLKLINQLKMAKNNYKRDDNIENKEKVKS